MTYIGHVERIGRNGSAQRAVLGKSMEKKPLGISRCKVILETNLTRRMGMCTGLVWFRKCPLERSYEHDTGLLSVIMCQEFLAQISNS